MSAIVWPRHLTTRPKLRLISFERPTSVCNTFRMHFFVVCSDFYIFISIYLVEYVQSNCQTARSLIRCRVTRRLIKLKAFCNGYYNNVYFTLSLAKDINSVCKGLFVVLPHMAGSEKGQYKISRQVQILLAWHLLSMVV